MKQDKFLEMIRTIALAVIAINLIYSNIHQRDRQTQAMAVDSRVVEVMGRATVTIGGYNARPAFLIKDGDKFGLVDYDQGSVADQPGFKPEYLRIIKTGEGGSTLTPFTIERFEHGYPIQIEQAYRP